MNRYAPLLMLLVACCSSTAVAQDVPRTTDQVTAIRQLAEKGNAKAQTNLGLMYSIGWGVAENDAEAVKWYRLAASEST